jgi:hypothetical protein
LLGVDGCACSSSADLAATGNADHPSQYSTAQNLHEASNNDDRLYVCTYSVVFSLPSIKKFSPRLGPSNISPGACHCKLQWDANFNAHCNSTPTISFYITQKMLKLPAYNTIYSELCHTLVTLQGKIRYLVRKKQYFYPKSTCYSLWKSSIYSSSALHMVCSTCDTRILHLQSSVSQTLCVKSHNQPSAIIHNVIMLNNDEYVDVVVAATHAYALLNAVKWSLSRMTVPYHSH